LLKLIRVAYNKLVQSECQKCKYCKYKLNKLIKICHVYVKYRMHHQNLDKFLFKFSVIFWPPPEVVVGVWESLMLLVNNHILKMSAKPSAEYNRKVAIIEGLRAGCSATKIIRFFGYPINRLWYCGKIYSFRTIQRRFQYASKSHSKERTAIVEKAQTLISDNRGQSLRKLASIV